VESLSTSYGAAPGSSPGGRLFPSKLGKESANLGRPGRIAGTREFVVSETPYAVPYRVAGADVEILAVVHGARRWPDKLA
jgi:plasmid stabilization system protein ParE